jgi:hypothetical protein
LVTSLAPLTCAHPLIPGRRHFSASSRYFFYHENDRDGAPLLQVFMVIAGLGAWIFGNSGEAAVNSPAPHSSVR